MKIAIVGYGYVGRGIHRLFGDWVDAIYDPTPLDEPREEARNLGFVSPEDNDWANNEMQEKVNNCDLVVVCVPTSQKADGSADTSIVESAIAWLETPRILIKSTVPPGTTKRLAKKFKKNIAFSPEFMGEGGYFTPPWKYPHPTEMKMHTFQIFGGPKKLTNDLVDIFIRKMGPHVDFYQTDSTTAEVSKYAENSWGSTKVIWANEFYEICEAFGVDYREMREMWAADSRVEKMHTAVFTHSRGYGGKCFPKDIAAIIKASEDAGYEPKLLKQVVESNKYFNSLNEK